ncbi:MAG TPA: ABC transporter substrate-binding protein [Hyphomicrobiales bacterium]|nr:ABC transporter substrate-binding protein [Hyphomicrobiales bacterium]
MISTIKLLALGAGAAVLAAALPAEAQKAQDALRVAYTDPISTTNGFFDPKPETAAVQRAVYSTLIVYDPTTRTFKPDLATAWKRVGPTTLEFTLRQGVTWHDGTPFTADDVVDTFNWLVDPKTRLRFGFIYTSRFAKAEKVDDRTVRVEEKGVFADDLMTIAVNLTIFPKHVIDTFANKADFAREKPIGTGPYKVVSISPSTGVKLVKFDKYVSPGPWRPAASISKIDILPIPDLQTEMAQLMTGGIDLMHDVPRDQALQIVSNPDYKMTVAQGLNVFYMNMDAAGRSGNKALTDVRVRKALEMAVDRQALAKNVAPPGATTPNAICVPVMIGCAVSNAPPAHDVAGAKKLLAEAGYPNGFDVDMVSNPGGEQISEAIAGQLREAGVRAKVEHLTFAGYRARQVAGKLELLIGNWDAGGTPDEASTVNFFWDGGARDYARDKEILKLGEEATRERDAEKRDALYRKIFDINNEKAYDLPLTTFPAVFVHTKDLKVETDTIGALAVDYARLQWQ